MTDWPFGLLRKNHYGLIAIDFPWQYSGYSGDGVPQRKADQHYPTMSIDEIRKLPIADLAANNCAVLAWVISSHTPMLFPLMDHFGFKYSSKAFSWAKLNKHAEANHRSEIIAAIERGDPEAIKIADDRNWFIGMGKGSRRNTEDCYLFTRGAPKCLDHGVRELIVAPVREHSRKPDEFLERAERLFAGPRLEMFSRSNRAGWSVFGNETGKF